MLFRSKITADLVKKNKLSLEEADILFSIANNISPMFICGYILNSKLHCKELTIPFLIAVYGPPIFYGIVVSSLKSKKKQTLSKTPPEKKAVSRINFDIIDTAIMNGFETMIKLGGYIIIFSIVISFVAILPGKLPILKGIMSGLLEITNGVNNISAMNLSISKKTILLSVLVSFGGLSGIFQTSSMIKGTGLKIENYVVRKLLFAAMTFFLAVCLIK